MTSYGFSPIILSVPLRFFDIIQNLLSLYQGLVKSTSIFSSDAKLFADFSFVLDKIISIQHPSQISYRSEFHQSKELQELMEQHPF
jgi:hypothetical protein